MRTRHLSGRLLGLVLALGLTACSPGRPAEPTPPTSLPPTATSIAVPSSAAPSPTTTVPTPTAPRPSPSAVPPSPVATQPSPVPAGPIELPAEQARVTLPLHVLARVGTPDQTLTLAVRWQDGTLLEQRSKVLRGPDGRGLVIDSIDWTTESQPPQPPTQPASLEIRDPAGAVLARRGIQVLAANDPGTTTVTVYWVLGEQLQPVERRVVRTEGIGAAALNELLWGPGPRNFAGFTTAIPTPSEVLAYPGRDATWGSRVRLLGLNIVDGVATANFSREMKAYGGGSLRVAEIRDQVTRTLRQFSTVREVRIAVEGALEGVLEP